MQLGERSLDHALSHDPILADKHLDPPATRVPDPTDNSRTLKSERSQR